MPEKAQVWILVCNTKVFYIHAEFREKGFCTWNQRRDFKVGDIVYIYETKPVSKIIYKRFEQQRKVVLDAAREGWIVVSAFISPKEREIKQQLMAEMLPFIEITDNGFSDKYKGTGKAFYALAENRLLQITPWTYLYQKDGAQVSREMCLVMNELARVVSGRADDWWKQRQI